MPAAVDERRHVRRVRRSRCTGTAVTGVAFPLGNYHNATTNLRDPDGGVGAEYIALPDFLGGVELMAEAMRGSGGAPAERRLPDVGADVRERMRATAGE